MAGIREQDLASRTAFLPQGRVETIPKTVTPETVGIYRIIAKTMLTSGLGEINVIAYLDPNSQDYLAQPINIGAIKSSGINPALLSHSHMIDGLEPFYRLSDELSAFASKNGLSSAYETDRKTLEDRARELAAKEKDVPVPGESPQTTKD